MIAHLPYLFGLHHRPRLVVLQLLLFISLSQRGVAGYNHASSGGANPRLFQAGNYTGGSRSRSFLRIRGPGSSSSSAKEIASRIKGGAGSTRVMRRRTRYHFLRQQYLDSESRTILGSSPASALPLPRSTRNRFPYVNRELLVQSQGSTATLFPPYPLEEATTTPQHDEKVQQQQQNRPLSKVDLSLPVVYFCSAMALTFPVVLVPLIGEAHTTTAHAVTSFVGNVASISILGGGIGKIVNGMVCQKYGGKATASTCLVGVAVCSYLLSRMSSATILLSGAAPVGHVVAGLEFFASALWVSCSLILANHYKNQPALFARGVTFLSLSSTTGQLGAKLLGSALVSAGVGWRTVARLGAAVALFGAFVLRTMIPDQQKEVMSPHRAFLAGGSQPVATPPVLEAVKTVVSHKVFWLVGLAHISGYVARTCDKVLGPFIKEVTSLPRTYNNRLSAFCAV